MAVSIENYFFMQQKGTWEARVTAVGKRLRETQRRNQAAEPGRRTLFRMASAGVGNAEKESPEPGQVHEFRRQEIRRMGELSPENEDRRRKKNTAVGLFGKGGSLFAGKVPEG